MTEHRLTFAFPGMSQRKFNAIARELSDRLEDEIGKDAFECYTAPSGPPEWSHTGVTVRLDGIRAERHGDL